MLTPRDLMDRIACHLGMWALRRLPCGAQDAEWERIHNYQQELRVMRAAITVLKQAGL